MVLNSLGGSNKRQRSESPRSWTAAGDPGAGAMSVGQDLPLAITIGYIVLRRVGGVQCLSEFCGKYERAFSRRSGLRPRHLLEIGMWDDGSLAFWNEILHPEKIVGVDLTARQDSGYFRDYVQGRGLESKLRSVQADERALLRIVEQEFGGALDMVMDDASHMYEPTLASFQNLFPLLPEGGLYIIEDWAWEHWTDFHAPSHPWVLNRSPTRLVFELIEATGTSRHLITSVEVFQGFVIVERGPEPASRVSPLLLADQIARRPPFTVTVPLSYQLDPQTQLQKAAQAVRGGSF